MKIDAETLKKQVILHLPYVLFLLVFAKLGEAVRLAPGADASQKLLWNAERCCSEAHQSWTRTESLCVMKKERSSMSPIKYGYSIRSISRKVCTLTRSPTFIPRKIF